ncbi:hypothetical protein Tco_1264810 [Tanacetum coccineum]
MFLNMDQLEKQLDNKEFQEIGSMAAFKVLSRTKAVGQNQKSRDKVVGPGNYAHADDAEIDPILMRAMGMRYKRLLKS